MKNDPLVSIILPVYNVEIYLDDCFNSLIKQSYKNIEIIFVDDGSTDNSGNKLDEYLKKDKRVKVYHKKNEGVSSAKNLGIKNATGDYITFVDSDDYVTEEYVEYLLNLLKSNNADIAYTKNFFDNYNNNQVKNENIKIIDSNQALYEILTYKISVGVWNKIFRKELLTKKNIYFYEDIFMGEGFNFNVLAFMYANRIVTSNKKIYFYRRDNNNSATTKFTIKKWQNALVAIEKIKENLKDVAKNEKIKDALKFAEWRTNVDAYTLLYITNNQKNYVKFKNNTLKIGKMYANVALKLNTTRKDKIRAIIIKIYPPLLAKLLLIRRRIYNVNVKN